MLVIALALTLVAAACAVVLVEASRSVIPPMAPVVREAGLAGKTAPAIPTQRVAGEIGSAKADSGQRTYAFIAELPADNATGFDVSL